MTIQISMGLSTASKNLHLTFAKGNLSIPANQLKQLNHVSIDCSYLQLVTHPDTAPPTSLTIGAPQPWLSEMPLRGHSAAVVWPVVEMTGGQATCDVQQVRRRKISIYELKG